MKYLATLTILLSMFWYWHSFDGRNVVGPFTSGSDCQSYGSRSSVPGTCQFE